MFHILKKLKLKPEEVIMIGDSIEKDLVTSKKMGMTTVFAKYGGSREKPKADYNINDIKQLLTIVNKVNK